jgi:integrase
VRNLLLVHAKPLHTLPVNKVKSDDIFKALKDKWRDTPDQMHRVILKIAKVLDYAKVKLLRHGENPARWKGHLEHLFPKLPDNEEENLAAMPFEDVPEFIKALRERQGRGVAATALEFTILTAVRSNEALAAEWSEFDFENKLWTIPADRMKTKQGHIVPLSDRAMEILKRRREQRRADSEYVFFGHTPKEPMAENSMRAVLYTMRIDFTVHGFRTSFRDWGGDETDFADETLEFCLSHKVKGTTKRAYRRRTAIEKRREAMDAWAAYCG